MTIKGEVIWLPVAVLLRGDHSVNETKLLSAVVGSELRPMVAEELEQYFHGPAGYLGPIGLKPKKVLILDSGLPNFVGDGDTVVILDHALTDRQNMVCGANKLDYHLRNITPGRDFKPSWIIDARNVNEGEGCPQDGCGGMAVEIGHIFKLGYKYSESMGARVLDENGKEVTPIMGSYGIGIERILTASIEQANDKNGFWLPAAIAPFTVVVTVTNASDAALAEVGEKLAAELEAAGLDVLLDDRDERAGVKFKDADLVGIPYRVNVGRKAAGGFVELQTRATATSVDVAIHDVVASVKARVEEDALLTAVEA